MKHILSFNIAKGKSVYYFIDELKNAIIDATLIEHNKNDFDDLYSDLALNFLHNFPHPYFFIDRRFDFLTNYLKDKNGTTQAFRFKNKILKMKELASNSLCFVSFDSLQV